MGAAEAAAFLTELEVSGNARRATATAGLGLSMPYRRRALDREFAAAWDAALDKAAARTAAAIAAGAPERDRVRRLSGGRPQLATPRAGQWTVKTERVFLDVLSATANATAAARATGVSAAGAWVRRRHLPAFAQAWDEAVADGHARLEMLMMERGTSLLGGEAFAPGGGRRAPDDRERDEHARDEKGRDAFDPQIAMWLLKRRDQLRAGTSKMARSWERVPDIEEVRESIMRKLDAMRRSRERGLRLDGADATDSAIEAVGHRQSIEDGALDTRTHDS